MAIFSIWIGWLSSPIAPYLFYSLQRNHRLHFLYNITFNVLIVLVGQKERHWACKEGVIVDCFLASLCQLLTDHVFPYTITWASFYRCVDPDVSKRLFFKYFSQKSANFFCNNWLFKMHPISEEHTHTHPFNGPLSGTTQMSRYQKGKTKLDFTGARDSEWQRHQLGHMQVCTSLQTSQASTPPLSFLQAGCHSCRPTNSVKALRKAMEIWSDA